MSATPLVSPGSSIVVADGIMADLADVPHGEPSWGRDNPAAAVEDFLSAHPEFEVEREESLSYFRNGWLKRVR
jgi:cephalosporin hydroxylase